MHFSHLGLLESWTDTGSFGASIYPSQCLIPLARYHDLILNSEHSLFGTNVHLPSRSITLNAALGSLDWQLEIMQVAGINSSM